MNALPEEFLTSEIRRIRAEESRLDNDVRRMEEGFSGLRDIDLVLCLADVKLSLAVKLLEVVFLRREPGSFEEAGGGGFLEARQAEARSRRLLARAIVAAVRKFTGPDDRSAPLDPDDYPPFIRKILLLLFPVMIREKPGQPPDGIEEGEEVTYSSRNMRLPLSQAVFYLENEMIPDLEKKLAEDPGNGLLQNEIRRLRDRAEDYRKLRFFPRSTPVLLERLPDRPGGGNDGSGRC